MSDITFPLSSANVAQVVAEKDAEIERLRAEILDYQRAMSDMAKRDVAAQDEIEFAEERNREAAVFLDGLAVRLDSGGLLRCRPYSAADCRAMAARLRGET